MVKHPRVLSRPTAPELPQTIVLDPLVFRDLQIALLQKQLLEQQLHHLTQVVSTTMCTAGLDPQRNYRLDPTTDTAILLP